MAKLLDAGGRLLDIGKKYYQPKKDNLGGMGFKWVKPDPDMNVVKIQKPVGCFYIPIKVTQTIYTPSTGTNAGDKIITVNICQIIHYCQSTVFGKKEVQTVIMQTDGRIYVKETWQQLDKLIDNAIAKYMSMKVQV